MKNPGKIVTFYSYKGGTGRSMALANFAWILAANGKRVITIDWDLEAPGLHRYFRPFLIDPDLYETDGLIDMFWTLTASAMASSSGRDFENANNLDNSPIAEALEDATRRLDWDFGPNGFIDFIGAGRQGGTYSERVNSFDWKRFYDLGGAALLSSAKAYLCENYQWVLIDSRTGVSDTSGVCTIQMPEAVVACFTLNRQSIDGITGILRSIREFSSLKLDGSKIRFFPVAMRIENNEKRRLEQARSYARKTLEKFVTLSPSEGVREYWDKMEIGYIPAYAFEEVLAIFGDPSGAGGAKDTLLTQFESMAQKIAGTENLKAPEIIEADREWVLKKYALAESQSTVTEPVGDATSNTEFLRSIYAKESQWRSLGHPWRLLLSQRELDLLTPEDRKGFGRNMFYYLKQSERMRELRDRANSSWGKALAASITAGTAAGLISLFGAQFMGLNLPVPPPELALLYGYATFLALMTTLQVFRALSISNRPYGLTVLSAINLCIVGPFAQDIRDYTPLGPSGRSIER